MVPKMPEITKAICIILNSLAVYNGFFVRKQNEAHTTLNGVNLFNIDFNFVSNRKFFVVGNLGNMNKSFDTWF